MDRWDVVPGVLGAVIGVTGWLLVRVCIQRRPFTRQARSAAKAVYSGADARDAVARGQS